MSIRSINKTLAPQQSEILRYLGSKLFIGQSTGSVRVRNNEIDVVLRNGEWFNVENFDWLELTNIHVNTNYVTIVISDRQTEFGSNYIAGSDSHLEAEMVELLSDIASNTEYRKPQSLAEITNLLETVAENTSPLWQNYYNRYSKITVTETHDNVHTLLYSDTKRVNYSLVLSPQIPYIELFNDGDLSDSTKRFIIYQANGMFTHSVSAQQEVLAYIPDTSEAGFISTMESLER